MVDLIYCADGNPRFAKIAIHHGFLYGARLPGALSLHMQERVYFADQDWKNPDLDSYIRWVKKIQPALATVLDWEEPEQISIVMYWARKIAPFVKEVLIIPKVPGGIQDIPQEINEKPVRLAYSVPSRYGKSDVPIEEFGTRPVHLLGGSPHKQMELADKMNVVSVDGNYMQKMAIQYGNVWTINKRPRRRVFGSWLRLHNIIGDKVDADVPYVAFGLSCFNIARAWGDRQ